tara:strand:- start:319 stop:3705 length:3387 start_codon:yes stop_codon:yes gene_type:complete
MGSLARGRRVPRRLGFAGVARRVALTLAVVQLASCAVLAAEAAPNDGSEAAVGMTTAPVTAPPNAEGSSVTIPTEVHAPSAPTVDDTPGRGVPHDTHPSDLKPEFPAVDASFATVCLSHGLFRDFDKVVLQQTNSSDVAHVGFTCVSDAQEGALAASQAQEALEAEKKAAALAKKKEKEKEKKIPSLKDFKSDLQAKVADARDAKKEKANVEREKKEGKVVEEGKVPVEAANVPKTDEKIQATDRETKESDSANSPDASSEGSSEPLEPVPTPSGTSDEIAVNEKSTHDGSSPAKPTPTPDASKNKSERKETQSEMTPSTRLDVTRKKHGTGVDTEEPGGEGETSSRGPEASGEPSVEPTPVPSVESWEGEGRKTSGAETVLPKSANADESGVGKTSPTTTGDTSEALPGIESSAVRKKDTVVVHDVPEPSVESSLVESDELEAESGGVNSDTDSDPESETSNDAASYPDAHTDPYGQLVTPSPPEVADLYQSEYNYASSSNGAKVVSSNAESKSASAALKENKDSYFLTPCITKHGKWITVELSEEVAVTAVTVANFEFHSSAPETFEVWGTSGAADNDDGWRLLGKCKSDPGMKPQTFVLPGGGLWSKHVRVEMTSHYGNFHFCTLSLFRVHGKDANTVLKEEMEAIDAEAREVEEILRDADELYALREKEKEEADLEAEKALDRKGDESWEGEETVHEAVNERQDDAPVVTDCAETLSNVSATASEIKSSDDTSASSTEKPEEEPTPTENGGTVPATVPDRTKEDDLNTIGLEANEVEELGGKTISSVTETAPNTGAPETVPLAEEERLGTNGGLAPGEKTSSPGDKPTTTSEVKPTMSVSDPDKTEKKEKPTPSSSSNENVFSIMAKKIKALELNQSMFDRYVEASTQNVADRFEDLGKEMEVFEEILTNTSSTLKDLKDSNVAGLEKSVADVKQSTGTHKQVVDKKLHAADAKLSALENKVARQFLIHRIGACVGLYVVSIVLALHALTVFVELAEGGGTGKQSVEKHNASIGVKGLSRVDGFFAKRNDSLDALFTKLTKTQTSPHTAVNQLKVVNAFFLLVVAVSVSVVATLLLCMPWVTGFAAWCLVHACETGRGFFEVAKRGARLFANGANRVVNWTRGG